MPYLFILPFDHRGSFQKLVFGENWKNTPQQKEIIKRYKRVIFESMKKIGAKRGVQDLGILVDEEYGADIHAECEKLGIRHILTTEKSGQKIFDFEYPDWKEHLKHIKPTYAKALIRVVMGEDHSIQNSRLKELNDFCAEQKMGFLIEPLIEPNEADLSTCGGDKKRFDQELRAKRFAEAVAEMHTAGVKPDVWKIEGTESKEAMDICSNAAFDGGKPDIQIVILGRGETQDKVDLWLRAGAKSRGVNGFAIGRTVFGDVISRMHKGELTEEQAIDEIAKNYEHGIEVFLEAMK